MYDEGLTAIQHIQERLANQIRNALDSLGEYALAVTVGHGGQPYVISTNYDESEQESPLTARPGLALDVSSVYEVDGEGLIWLLKIVITIRPVGEINAILERLNTAETKKQKGLLRSMAQEQPGGRSQDWRSGEQATRRLGEVRHIPEQAKVGKERNWVVARAGLEQERAHRSLLLVD